MMTKRSLFLGTIVLKAMYCNDRFKNNNKVTNLGYATHVAAENDKLYCVDSRVDYSSWPEVAAVNTFYTYDVKAGTKSSGSFLKMLLKNLARQLFT